MSEIITAVYSNGMLRPQNPLSLTDGQTVRLQVLTEEADETEQIIQSLVAARLVTPPPHRGDVEPFSEEAVGNWLKGWVNVLANPYQKSSLKNGVQFDCLLPG